MGNAESGSLLTKKDVSRASLRWWLMSHLAYNYQRMQAGAFASMMGPLFKKLYKDDTKNISEGLKRHMMFFNTEPRWGAVIHGITIALEEQKAKEPGSIDDTSIIDMKSSLMGPMAGMGDTLTQALFKPIMLSICLGWASQGNILGAIVFGLVGLSFDFFVTRYSLFFGYNWGTEAVAKLLQGGLIKKMTTIFSIMGLFVLGTMICKFITVGVVFKFVTGNKEVVLGALLDKILPKAVPLLIAIFAWRAMLRGWSVVRVLVALFTIALLGGFFGILG